MKAVINPLIENIVIHPMTKTDIAKVRRLEAEANLAAWSQAGYESELNNPDSICLVAKVEKKIVGFLISRLIMSDYYCEVYNIGVDSKFKRRKIGSKLLINLHNTCIFNNLKEIQLEVRESNKTAIEFYTKLGYKFRFTRKNFYSNPCENAIVMINNLK